MRLVTLSTVALALCAIAQGVDASLVEKFNGFKSNFGKKYKSADEEAKRFRIFADNMERAQALQASNPHASFGINEFADMTASEFKSRHNAEEYYAKRKTDSGVETKHMTAEQKTKAAGTKVDWRQHGAVTPIKNQGQCGSCWSFSTTGGIEGQWFLSGNPLVSLSEQEFVSCDTIDDGCKGGLMDNAFKWILEAHNGTLVTEASYPYVSGEGYVPQCNMTDRTPAATINGYYNVAGNEDDMAAWVLQHGPLSIGVDATAWQMYTGGIMTNCIGLAVDHGVLIVGYDDQNQPPYWIVKNSWGPIWGEQGYIRVQKGDNQCMLTFAPSTSTVKVSGPTPNPGPTSEPEPTPPTSPTKAPKPYPKGWVDLLPPPYNDGPQIAMAISCLDSTSCMVPGGDNGAGFGIFNFNGQWDGYFRHVNAQQDGEMAMDMAIGVGGTAANPHGAVGGMDFGAVPQYFTGPYQVNNSVTVPFVVTQSMSADKATGMNVIFADGFDGNENTLWVSTNGGLDYSSKVANGKLTNANCTFINSQVIVSDQVWYVVLGGNPAPPPNPNPPPPPFASFKGAAKKAKRTGGDLRRNRGFEQLLDGDVTVLHRKSSSHAIVRDNKDGKVKHAFVNYTRWLKQQEQQPVHNLGENGCPFTAAIMKTTDGGSTWTTVFEKVGEGFMMDFIDCADENTCVAIGSGANVSHTPGAHAFRTTDGGSTWTEVLNIPGSASSMAFLGGVQFNPLNKQEVLIAGNTQSNDGGYAEFWQSNDGGATWAVMQRMDFLMATTDMSCGSDGVCFATMLTALQDSTIVRYTPNGVPQTPAPTYNGNFTQIVCPNSGTCGGECQQVSLPQGTCLNMTNGFSAQVFCDMADGVLLQKIYPLDKVCWGPAEEQMIPLDRCLVGNPGTIKFQCGSASTEEYPVMEGASYQAVTKVTPVKKN